MFNRLKEKKMPQEKPKGYCIQQVITTPANQFLGISYLSNSVNSILLGSSCCPSRCTLLYLFSSAFVSSSGRPFSHVELLFWAGEAAGGIFKSTVAALRTLQEMRKGSSTVSAQSLPPCNLNENDEKFGVVVNEGQMGACHWTPEAVSRRGTPMLRALKWG